MNFLLPPLLETKSVSALSELEEQLQGPERDHVAQHIQLQLQDLALRLEQQLQQGVSPAEFRVLGAVQDACSAALELIDSL